MSFILLFLLFLGCSEIDINPIPTNVGDVVETLEPGDPLDILIAIDTSCSMQENFPLINYGITQIAVETSHTDLDWNIGVSSADYTDDFFVEINETTTVDPGWTMAATIQTLAFEASDTEAGFSSTLYTLEDREFFRPDAARIVIMVSDEAEQSGITPEDYLLAWEPQPYIISIVGTGPSTSYVSACRYDQGTGYLDVSDMVVDICTREPWSIYDF